MPVYLTPPPRNPLLQALAAIVAALALVGAFMLGLVALAVVAGLAILVGAAAWIQAWRVRRRLRTVMEQEPASREEGFIEAEYTVISRREERNG